jgi:hypothetical protein
MLWEGEDGLYYLCVRVSLKIAKLSICAYFGRREKKENIFSKVNADNQRYDNRCCKR